MDRGRLPGWTLPSAGQTSVVWSGPLASALTSAANHTHSSIQNLFLSEAAALVQQQQTELIQLGPNQSTLSLGEQQSNSSNNLLQNSTSATSTAASVTNANETSGTGPPFSAWDLLLIALLISIILISIVGNCLVCIAIFTDRRLRKLGNAFIVSLAIADLFVSCLVMTFALCNDLMDYWMFGEWFCDIWISFDIMCCTASILNLCAISLDRFIHIKDCLLYNQMMTKRVAISAVIVIWIISALVSFVPINLGWHKPEHFRGPAILSQTELHQHSLDLQTANLHQTLQIERKLDEALRDGVTETRRRRSTGSQVESQNQIGGNFDKLVSENKRPLSDAAATKLRDGGTRPAQITPRLNFSDNKSGGDNEAPPSRPGRQSASGESLLPLAKPEHLSAGTQTIDRVGLSAHTYATSSVLPRFPLLGLNSGAIGREDEQRLASMEIVSSTAAQVQAKDRNDDDTAQQPQRHDESKHDRAYALYKNELLDQVESNPQTLEADKRQQQQFARRSQQQIKHSPPSPLHKEEEEGGQIGFSQAKARARRRRRGEGEGEQTNGDSQTGDQEGGATLLDQSQFSNRNKTPMDDGLPLAPPPPSGEPLAGLPFDSSTNYNYYSTPAPPPTRQQQQHRHTAPATTTMLPQCMLTLTPTYAVISSTISFYIPCIIMLGLYSKLFACARRHVRNIKAISKAPHPIGGGAGGIRSPQVGMQLGEQSNDPTNGTVIRGDRLHSKSTGHFGSKLGRLVGRRPAGGLGLGDKSRTWIKFGRPNRNQNNQADCNKQETQPAAVQQLAQSAKTQAQGSCSNPVLTKLKANLRQNAQFASPNSNAESADKTNGDESEPFLDGGGGGESARNDRTPREETEGGDTTAATTKTSLANCSPKATPPTIIRLNPHQIDAAEANKADANVASSTQSPQITAPTYGGVAGSPASQQQAVNNNHYHYQQQPTYQQPTKQQTSQLATHKAAITLGIIMGTFLFCWVPFFCLNIIKAFHGDSIPSSLFRAFTWLGYANSALNPIIYGIHNSEFRNAFNRIFFKHLTLKNGRQYLNRRFSYDLRPHHHHQQSRHHQGQHNNNNQDNHHHHHSGPNHERQALNARQQLQIISGGDRSQLNLQSYPTSKMSTHLERDYTSNMTIDNETMPLDSGHPIECHRPLQEQQRRQTSTTLRSLTTVHRTSEDSSSRSACQALSGTSQAVVVAAAAAHDPRDHDIERS